MIVKEEGAVLWVNLGHPIVTNGTLLCSCVEVHEPIKLSWGGEWGWLRDGCIRQALREVD